LLYIITTKMDIMNILDTMDIDTNDITTYNNPLVEKIYRTAFLAIWVLFSQIF
jgi:hypothetical protein